MQFTALVLAFVVVIIATLRNVRLWLALGAGTAVMALVSGTRAQILLESAGRALSDSSTINLVLGVTAVTALAGVIKTFGWLDALMQSLMGLLGNVKLVIMALPSVVGALPVPGGAVISAPMVDTLGQRLSLTPTRKAAVNLVFRHAWFLVAPFSPTLILASELGEVRLSRLIGAQWPLAAAALIAGYVFLLQGTQAADSDAAPAGRGKTPESARMLRSLLESSSPLVLATVLCLGVGPVRLPFYLAMTIGLVWALVLSRKKPGFEGVGLRVVWSSIDWNITLTIVALMILGRLMRDIGSANVLVSHLTTLGLNLWALAALLPFLLGFISGSCTVAIGTALPLILPHVPLESTVTIVAISYASAFIAHLTSPIHLCQVLTAQYFRVNVVELFREYLPVALATAAALAVYAGTASAVL